ncbi:MAG: hypothetical protein GXO50_07845 [Chlorobi bacterium]|nr:hypothetical protein [Chlorobiota bacterium]
MKKIMFVFISFGLFMLSSCDKEDWFEQPSIEVTGISLRELPGDYTYLNIDLSVINNDSRDAEIKDVEYTAVIEGISAEPESCDINKEMLSGTPLALTLPLTLKTKDAIKLLAKLNAGESLDYTVKGTFHVDEPVLKYFDLPLNVGGTANIDVGFEDFYEQPEVTVTKLGIASSEDTGDGFEYNFEVTCDIKNKDERSVTVDEIEYTVNIAGIPSQTHYYSDTYSENLVLEGGETVSLTLPVTIILDEDQETDFNNALASGTVDYSVEGTFHAVKINETASDFILPLYVTGNISVEDLFGHPDITVNDIEYTYTADPLADSYTIYMDVNTSITNTDERSVNIDEVEYVVTVEDVVSETHYYSDTYSDNLVLAGGETVDLTLPVTLHLNTAEGLDLLNDLSDGYADYIIDGTFHAVNVDGEDVNLLLPLHDTGSVPVSEAAK